MRLAVPVGVLTFLFSAHALADRYGIDEAMADSAGHGNVSIGSMLLVAGIFAAVYFLLNRLGGPQATGWIAAAAVVALVYLSFNPTKKAPAVRPSAGAKPNVFDQFDSAPVGVRSP